MILGAVIDENLSDEMMVTVIATGFNKRGVGAVRIAKPMAKVIERIPAGLHEIQKLDEPAFMRKGIDISLNPFRTEEKGSPASESREARPGSAR